MSKGCITLIGMPASGKSTVGVVLAKKTGRRFLDGDLIIQEQTGKLLKELIAEHGDDGFRALENEIHAGLQAEYAVIAPGGSVVYGEDAMAHLRALGTVIYLKLPYPAIRRRLGNLEARGVSIKKGQSLKQLYDERVKLYEKYADITIDETGLGTRKVVEAIVEALGEGGGRNGQDRLEARKHALSGSGSHGKLQGQRRKSEHHHRGMGRNRVL
ncbi:shikimate kinase [Lachnospiraceae bacterium]|nr:shikimate kinase [Lachnospiraceae bacterium]